MKTIPLTRGYETIVDDDVYVWASKHKWHAAGTTKIYAIRKVKRKQVALHRVIMDAKPAGLVDHKSGNSLDNRRENLRIADHSQNAANRPPKAGRLKGIHWDKRSKSWRYDITCRQKKYRKSGFSTPELAMLAHLARAKELFGEFAWDSAKQLDPLPPPIAPKPDQPTTSLIQPKAIKRTYWPHGKRNVKSEIPIVRPRGPKMILISKLARALGVTSKRLIESLNMNGFGEFIQPDNKMFPVHADTYIQHLKVKSAV
jgi:hypothetical protein